MATKQLQPVYVVGVGMTKFIKPRGKVDYPELGFEAGLKAMLDARIGYDEVEQGIACYCYGDSACGQRVFYQFGMTQIPIFNVNNMCSTGSTGIYLARQAIAHGVADCVLVIGFEKMQPGSPGSNFEDREEPTEPHLRLLRDTKGWSGAPGPSQLFGNAGQEYIERYGAQPEDFAEIARVNHAHSQKNPYSQFTENYTLDEIMSSNTIHGILTKLQCCPTSDGGAAAVLVSEAFLNRRPDLRDQAILVAGQCLATDSPQAFSKSAIDLVGYQMTKTAGGEALKQAGITPDDVQVLEVHDCFSTNEMLIIDALGLSPPGTAHTLVRNGDITHGGKFLINPSGGLISKGHPIGATGLAQCAELSWHLRGWANNRSVNNTRYCLQHNLGLGGAVVVTVYQRADGKATTQLTDAEVGRENGLGHNPATQARGFTTEQMRRTLSRKAFSTWAAQDVQSKVMARF